MSRRGIFIVIYGINNLGKTTQAKLLVERLRLAGRVAEYLKYPLYDLRPTGPLINDYLRHGNPYNFSPREFQILNVQNRMQFQSDLQKILANGVDVVAEDYTGTGIAWGVGAGVDKDLQLNLNSRLIDGDIQLLFDGERFSDGKEKGHRHEEDDDLIKRVRNTHLELAKQFDWRVINANQPIEVIKDEVWAIIQPIL